MATKAKRVVFIPSTIEEASQSLEAYGLLELEKEALEAGIEARIARFAQRLREKAQEKLTPIETQLDDRLVGLQAFAEKHRKTLPPDNNKTIPLPTGELYWRNTPPKVSTGKTKEEIIIGRIEILAQETGKEDYAELFIRTEKSLDKEAMLRYRPVIPGVKYTSKENFYAKAMNGATEVKTVVEATPEKV